MPATLIIHRNPHLQLLAAQPSSVDTSRLLTGGRHVRFQPSALPIQDMYVGRYVLYSNREMTLLCRLGRLAVRTYCKAWLRQ